MVVNKYLAADINVHKKKWKLAKVLLKFLDVIFGITEDLYLNSLCEFCYEVSCAFTEFYDKCYYVEKNQYGEIVKINMGHIYIQGVNYVPGRSNISTTSNIKKKR
ncbi:putative arginyl-tRNA synthetase, cytoplasmic [Trachymyrmex cornetzi]|uniref:Putative arginyl-tRNA synthetase, cytoplasmic n=1 Tax=Trachymyrmex cornetzi TaxID=471704 RepID=A0A151JA57_9HYME|nr:putative arginyl-tRNA synthetase, cytoplasmic [Trachymyrmex cornetzi]